MFAEFSTVNRRLKSEVLFVLFNWLFHEIPKVFFIQMAFEIFVMFGFKKKICLKFVVNAFCILMKTHRDLKS